MRPLRISEDEFRALLVGQLEIMDDAEFDRARKMASRLRIPLERAVVERSRVPLGFILGHIAEAWSVGFVDLKVSDVKLEALQTVAEEYARNNLLLPFDLKGNELHVAMADPRDRRIIDEITRTTRRRIVPFLAPESAIQRGHLLYRGNLRAMLERSDVDETLRVTQQSDSLSDGMGSGAELLRSEEHTSELQSPCNLVCRLLLEKKK